MFRTEVIFFAKNVGQNGETVTINPTTTCQPSSETHTIADCGLLRLQLDLA